MDFYFKRSLLGWAIKDSASRYIYVNDLACNYFKKSADRIIGRMDTELITGVGEHYKYILSNDNEIIKNNKITRLIRCRPSHPDTGYRQAENVKGKQMVRNLKPELVAIIIEKIQSAGFTSGELFIEETTESLKIVTFSGRTLGVIDADNNDFVTQGCSQVKRTKDMKCKPGKPGVNSIWVDRELLSEHLPRQMAEKEKNALESCLQPYPQPQKRCKRL